MSEMVERVANTIVSAMTEPDGWAKKSYSDADMKKVARAAIEAMREPTKDMMDAPTWYDGDEKFTPGDAEACWGEMIDAALK